MLSTQAAAPKTKNVLVPYAYLEAASEGELSISDLRSFISSSDAAIVLTLVRRELRAADAHPQSLAIVDRIAKSLGEIEASKSEALSVEAHCGYSVRRNINDVFHAAKPAECGVHRNG